MNILLIDDDEITNFYNTDLLKSNGYAKNIYVALNGAEGLQKLNELYTDSIEIDLIFLDINMPVMNGFEFLEKYDKLDHKIKSKIIICMLSSSIHKIDIENAENYPFINGYIEKALTKEKMEDIIAKHFS